MRLRYRLLVTGVLAGVAIAVAVVPGPDEPRGAEVVEVQR